MAQTSGQKITDDCYNDEPKQPSMQYWDKHNRCGHDVDNKWNS